MLPNNYKSKNIKGVPGFKRVIYASWVRPYMAMGFSPGPWYTSFIHPGFSLNPGKYFFFEPESIPQIEVRTERQGLLINLLLVK